MARFTVGGGIDVIHRFAARGHAVMTGLAATGNMIVVDHNRRPYQGGVTGIAGIAAADMVGNLARRCAAVVTTDAGPQHNTVINPVRCPELCVMTGFALQ